MADELLDKDGNVIKGGEGDKNSGGEGNQNEDDNNDEMSTEEVEAMVKENAALKSKNSRLEGESKEYKGKYNKKVSDEQQAVKDKLIADGKTDELLKVEREENQKIKDALVKTKSNSIRTKLENEILKLAPNCHDVSDIINNLNKELYSIDAENETVSDVEVALADVQKRKSYLFGKKGMPNSYNGDPSRKEPKGDKKITLAEYKALPTKKAMQDALGKGLVEGMPSQAAG